MEGAYISLNTFHLKWIVLLPKNQNIRSLLWFVSIERNIDSQQYTAYVCAGSFSIN